MPVDTPRITFVTGKLAAPGLLEVVHRLADSAGFVPDVSVQKISVAALMTADWLVGKLSVPEGTSRVILPGACTGDFGRLQHALGGVSVERGPVDFRDLPEFFNQLVAPSDYGAYDIEILAEINHANRLSMADILRIAARFRSDGADVIDVGCTPGEAWAQVGETVAALIAEGCRISIDSFDAKEVAAAANAGAELVLSVNKTNRRWAADWGREVVVLPDRCEDAGDDWLASLEATVEVLERDGIRYRLDPILDPIGFGFAASLGRYLQAREHFPDAALMMGVGNLTELTEVDSAGVNAVLIGFCAEVGVRSVLTTEVVNWARSSVGELDVARRLMRHAVTGRRLPKNVDPRLVALRDPRLKSHGEENLRRLRAGLRDPNFRLFAEEGLITAMNGESFEQDADAFALFERLGVSDPSHAFYLGWEMMKATLALQLGKRYTQDQALRWGLLTREEISSRERRRREAD